MDGRISYWLAMIALTLGCAGCLPFQTNKQLIADNPEQPFPSKTEHAKAKQRDDAPKRKALPQTEIKYGELKEGEADSDAAKKNPEAQSRLRDEARQAYQQAIKNDPSCIDAYKHLGRLYSKTGDFDRAFDIYKQLLSKEPKDASLWYDLGMCHHRRKDFPESTRCYAKALEIEPENREYLKKLGLTLAWQGQLETAFVYLSRAQGPALAHCNIAGLLIGRGDRDRALQHLRQAERLSPDLPQVRDLLSDLNQNPAANPRVAAK